MLNKRNLRIIQSIIMLFLFGFAISQPLEKLAFDYNNHSINGALAIYATTRALNAGISMLQGVDINALVLSVPIGEALDPLNDLIERFSWVVMMALVSLGIQKIMLGLVASQAMNLILASVGAIYLAMLWLMPQSKYRTYGYKLTCILLFVRFSLSIVLVCNYALDNYFFYEQKSHSESMIIEAQQVVANTSSFNLESQSTESEEGFFDKMKKTYSETKQSFSAIGDKVTNVSNSIDKAISSLLDLMIFFILQTVILPIGFLFVFYKILMRITGYKLHDPIFNK